MTGTLPWVKNLLKNWWLDCCDESKISLKIDDWIVAMSAVSSKKMMIRLLRRVLNLLRKLCLDRCHESKIFSKILRFYCCYDSHLHSLPSICFASPWLLGTLFSQFSEIFDIFISFTNLKLKFIICSSKAQDAEEVISPKAYKRPFCSYPLTFLNVPGFQMLSEFNFDSVIRIKVTLLCSWYVMVEMEPCEY